MKTIKDFLNRVNSIYFIWSYVLLVACLIFFKIKPYDFNISSIIGIWKGFAELNPTLVNKGFIIYNDGGYDGQFFYFISKSIFNSGFENLPILDSFHLRFSRIGLSLLSGTITNLFSFSYYPHITVLLLFFFHIYSFVILKKMLHANNKYLSYFYLFSPFSLNSNLLVVADSLFVSFLIFCIYLMKNKGILLFQIASNDTDNTKKNFVSAIVLSFLLFFTCLIRESGIVLLGTFFLICIFDKKIKNSYPIILAGLSYVIIIFFFKYFVPAHLGTNPLGFLDLIDYPLAGFYKSIQIKTFSDLKNLFRELAKFPIFIFFVILILNLKNIKKFRDIVIYIPIFFTIFTAGVGEVGYWLSFDNISRMFTLSLVWIIFLKDSTEGYKDYYALLISFLILILLIIRIVYIKLPMSYYNY